MATSTAFLCFCAALEVFGVVGSTVFRGQKDASIKLLEPDTLLESTASLTLQEKEARAKVRAVRGTGYDSSVDMQKDAGALIATRELQAVSKKLILSRYGEFARGKDARGTTFLVKMDVKFPAMMPDASGSTGVIVVETAPIELMPHAVLGFMEMAKNWKKGAFHRNAGHVLQIDTDRSHRGLAFQEYSDKYPHVPGTLGYAGRLGGPAFYISTIDNSLNHGPGSQGSKMGEADSCFGRVLKGQDVFDRLNKVWGQKQNGFHVDEMGFMSKEDEHASISLSLCNADECSV